jgi:hypothetical protein
MRALSPGQPFKSTAEQQPVFRRAICPGCRIRRCSRTKCPLRAKLSKSMSVSFGSIAASHLELASVRFREICEPEIVKTCDRPHCLGRSPAVPTRRNRCPIWADVECVGCFRFIFFAPPRNAPAKYGEEEQFGFHSSQPTHPTPSYISCCLLGDESRKDGKRNASVLNSGHSRGFTQTAGMCPNRTLDYPGEEPNFDWFMG